MNKLSPERRAAVIKALIDGASVRAACRMTGTAKGTVTRLLVELGDACRRFHDETVRNVAAQRVQCDEIWSFVGCKQKNVRPERAQHETLGDLWTWVGMDAETKLAIAYRVGARNPETAGAFVRDLAARLANRIQLTTDGNNLYLEAVAGAFHYDVDYAMLVKLYGSAAEEVETARYSPPRCVGCRKHWISGRPAERHVSTSYVERQNLTMRMQMRRFTRLTNAFSKKADNHAAAVALHFLHYNFCRVHQTLTKRNGGIHCTPAMAAGLTTYVWTAADIVALLDRPTLRLAS